MESDILEENNGRYDVDAIVAEVDADFAAGRWRRATPEEDAHLREAAGRALAQLKAEERKADMEASNINKTRKKQSVLVSA